ncbi:fibrillarin-like rRNA/tRNA 2'-O-methyltransferase [Candidatus Micrarchaeota archaeon]|nr:fibrillarin-like rRNA/tRNA 2'-O-methyltransferase [Candidatus Micrarchaeota archaeon]
MLGQKFEGVFLISGKLATKSFAPNSRVYDERTIKMDNTEYRFWDPQKSKASAAILKGLRQMPIRKGTKVLYLGAGSGTTASHFSDIVEDGKIYCVEFAPRSMRDLIRTCERRKNMLPILADARRPETYQKFIQDADVIYQDVAQPDQAKILINNSRMFLKKDSLAMIAVKSQCIDVVREPSEVYKELIEELEKNNFEVLDKMDLFPFDKDHLFILLRYKG